MTQFALINNLGIVENIIVAEQSFIDTLDNKLQWVQTNTDANDFPSRKNFASVGVKYDKIKDAFIYEKPFASWVLNEYTCLWQAPIPHPGTPATWNEDTLSWITITL